MLINSKIQDSSKQKRNRNRYQQSKNGQYELIEVYFLCIHVQSPIIIDDAFIIWMNTILLKCHQSEQLNGLMCFISIVCIENRLYAIEICMNALTWTWMSWLNVLSVVIFYIQWKLASYHNCDNQWQNKEAIINMIFFYWWWALYIIMIAIVTYQKIHGLSLVLCACVKTRSTRKTSESIIIYIYIHIHTLVDSFTHSIYCSLANDTFLTGFYLYSLLFVPPLLSLAIVPVSFSRSFQ